MSVAARCRTRGDGEVCRIILWVYKGHTHPGEVPGARAKNHLYGDSEVGRYP